MIIREVIKNQAEKHESFYIYDEHAIEENAMRLISDFKGIEFLYSIKANPAIKVVKSIINQGFGADAASIEEVRLAKKLGLSEEKVLYSAPGKSSHDIKEALGISTIVADSIDEVNAIQEIAKSRSIVAKIGIRINPSFTFYGDVGVPSKFGIDQDQVFDMIPIWKKLDNVRITGIHVHSKSQELNHLVLERYYRRMFELALSFRYAIDEKLEFVNMGSGFGIPYSLSDKQLDTTKLGESFNKMLREFKDKMVDTRIILESGRYIVGSSGTYVTHVLDKKVSMGKTFIILANTLNGYLRPCIAQLVKAYSESTATFGSEPLFTSTDSVILETLSMNKELEQVTLTGNLCTATDVVARDILLPVLKKGDIVAILNAGSYAWVLSPIQFSSQLPPAQIFLSEDGLVSDATVIDN